MSRHTGITQRLALAASAIVAVALATSLVACSTPPEPKPSAQLPVNVVAGENFWGDIARQIGGDRVKVTSIISDPETDPHLYESNAANAVALANAKVVIVNGLGYDDFMNRLVAGSGGQPEVVSAQKVLGEKDPNANPHLWYDLPRVPLVAKAIEQALVKADPAGEQVYAANLAKFESSLAPILATIEQIKTKYPGAPVAYTERVTGYLLDAAGLTVKTPPGFAAAAEEGTEPSPADARAMDALIRGKQVRLLLYNTQAVNAMTKRIREEAETAGVPVVGVSETLPPEYKSYQEWQAAQLQQILKALGG